MTNLSGQVACVSIVALLAAFPLALIFLHLYRRAVLRSMLLTSDAPAEADPAPQPAGNQIPLQIAYLDSTHMPPAPPQSEALAAHMARVPWLAGLLHLIGVLGWAAMLTLLTLLSENIDLLPGRFLTVWTIFAWPAVLVVNEVLGSTRPLRWALTGLYAAVLMGLMVLLALISPDVTLLSFAPLIAVYIIVPSLGLLFFLNPRIKAVGPLVLTFTLSLALGASLMLSLLSAWIAWAEARPASPAALAINLALGLLGANGLIVLTLLSGAGMAGIFGWLVLLLIRKLYENHWLSDQNLQTDSVMLAFTAYHAIFFSLSGLGWALMALLTFAVYKLLVVLGQSLLSLLTTPPPAAPRLLVLRVFSLGKRSEELYNALSLHWRYGGSIRFITGPDLLGRTIQPHQFINYLIGKLDRQFVRSRADMENRLQRANPQRNLEGRFGISDYFCYDNTWKIALRRLAATSDAIIMDLRGFTPQRAGCIFEIRELIQTIPMRHVLFVYDHTTDLPFLQEQIQQAWHNVPAHSPNLHAQTGPVRLFRLDGVTPGAVRTLLSLLCTAATT